MKVTDLRTISTQHAQRVLCIKLDSPGDIPPLFLEMFDEGGAHRQDYHPRATTGTHPSDEAVKIATAKAAAIVGGCIDLEGLNSSTKLPSLQSSGQSASSSSGMHVKDENVNDECCNGEVNSPYGHPNCTPPMHFPVNNLVANVNLFKGAPHVNGIQANNGKAPVTASDPPFRGIPANGFAFPTSPPNGMSLKGIPLPTTDMYSMPTYHRRMLPNGMPPHHRAIAMHVSPDSRSRPQNGLSPKETDGQNGIYNGIVKSPDCHSYSPMSGVSPLSPSHHPDHSSPPHKMISLRTSPPLPHNSPLLHAVRHATSPSMQTGSTASRSLYYSHRSDYHTNDSPHCDKTKNSVIPSQSPNEQPNSPANEPNVNYSAPPRQKEYGHPDGDTAELLSRIKTEVPEKDGKEIVVSLNTFINGSSTHTHSPAILSPRIPSYGGVTSPKRHADDMTDISSTYISKKLSVRYGSNGIHKSKFKKTLLSSTVTQDYNITSSSR